MNTRQPLSVQSVHLFLTPLLCQYATAILVILPRTFFLRLAILPITLFCAFRASTQLDLAPGDARFAHLNHTYVVRSSFLLLL